MFHHFASIYLFGRIRAQSHLAHWKPEHFAACDTETHISNTGESKTSVKDINFGHRVYTLDEVRQLVWYKCNVSISSNNNSSNQPTNQCPLFYGSFRFWFHSRSLDLAQPEQERWISCNYCASWNFQNKFLKKKKVGTSCHERGRENMVSEKIAIVTYALILFLCTCYIHVCRCSMHIITSHIVCVPTCKSWIVYQLYSLCVSCVCVTNCKWKKKRKTFIENRRLERIIR